MTAPSSPRVCSIATQEYDTFLKVYSTFQKIQAGQRQFQQHKDEIQAGTNSRAARQGRRRRSPGSETKNGRP